MWPKLKNLAKIYYIGTIILKIFGGIFRRKKEDGEEMSTLLDDVTSVVEKIKEKYADLIKDGKLSLADAWTLFQVATEEFARLAESFNVDGVQKKEMVLAALDKFYDEVLEPLNIPYVPDRVIEPMVDKFLKKVFLQLAGSAIDFIVAKIFPK